MLNELEQQLKEMFILNENNYVIAKYFENTFGITFKIFEEIIDRIETKGVMGELSEQKKTNFLLLLYYLKKYPTLLEIERIFHVTISCIKEKIIQWTDILINHLDEVF